MTRKVLQDGTDRRLSTDFAPLRIAIFLLSLKKRLFAILYAWFWGFQPVHKRDFVPILGMALAQRGGKLIDLVFNNENGRGGGVALGETSLHFSQLALPVEVGWGCGGEVIGVRTSRVVAVPLAGLHVDMLVIGEAVSYTHLDVYKRQVAR